MPLQTNDSGANAEPKKRPYHTPKLTTYGDIRSLTQNVGNAGMTDGGTGMMARSRP